MIWFLLEKLETTNYIFLKIWRLAPQNEYFLFKIKFSPARDSLSGVKTDYMEPFDLIKVRKRRVSSESYLPFSDFLN